jgi:carbonic anhydrase/acetyltransferase-like protein (isoleucine patch superfamily)
MAFHATRDLERLLAYLNTHPQLRPNPQSLTELDVQEVWDTGQRVDTIALASGGTAIHTPDGWVRGPMRDGIVIQGPHGRRIHQPGIDVTARIHSTARIAPDARVEPGALIGPYVTVGRHAHIGRDTMLMRETVIEPGAYIGADATIRTGASIGQAAIVAGGTQIEPRTRIPAGSSGSATASFARAGGRRIAFQAQTAAHTIERLTATNHD